MINGADRKVVIAYSSVAHMTICGFLLGFMGFIVGITHVVISPVIFFMVYVSYNFRGSRIIGSSLTSRIVGMVLLLNLRFPIIGAFIAEVYVVILVNGIVLLFFILAFLIIGLVHIKLFHPIKRNLDYEVLMWIIVLILLY